MGFAWRIVTLSIPIIASCQSSFFSDFHGWRRRGRILPRLLAIEQSLRTTEHSFQREISIGNDVMIRAMMRSGKKKGSGDKASEYEDGGGTILPHISEVAAALSPHLQDHRTDQGQGPSNPLDQTPKP